MRILDMLDVRTVIFGSGAARRCPQGMEKARATEKLVWFLQICDHVGDAYGIRTAIEPLNHTETNMLNTVSETAQLVQELGLSNIGILADMFHMAIEQEDPQELAVYQNRILHFHASEAPGRVYPGKFGGEYLKRCGAVLRKAAVEKDVTVECVFESFETQAAAAFQFMKENFA